MIEIGDPEIVAGAKRLGFAYGGIPARLMLHLGIELAADEDDAFDFVKALLHYLRGEPVEGTVNMGSLSLDLSDRQRRFVDLAARMIALLEAAGSREHLASVQFTLRGESIAGRADTIARYALADLLRGHLDQPVNESLDL